MDFKLFMVYEIIGRKILFLNEFQQTGVCLRFGLLCSEHSYPRLLPVFPEPKRAFFCFRLQKSAQPNPHPLPVLPAAKSKVP